MSNLSQPTAPTEAVPQTSACQTYLHIPRTGIHSLPRELLALVFELATEVIEVNNQPILRSLSLVCSEWTVIAQALLWRDIATVTEVNARWLLNSPVTYPLFKPLRSGR